ncbi:MAG: hypothetical protein R3E82_19620 [Pseudomonadales bacterium]|nr:hypothetical protein [Pseudomonadales bacterium]
MNAIAWPAQLLRLMLRIGVILAIVAVLTWLLFGALLFAGLCAVLALLCAGLRMLMGSRPMLEIRNGELLCHARDLVRRRYDLDSIRQIELRRQLAPAASYERHIYALRMRNDGLIWMLPQPKDAETRELMARFFAEHFPGRVKEMPLSIGLGKSGG